jgi:hypothetical protein
MGERSAASVARIAIAHLRQSVLAWIDGDQVLPADGASLLTMLDQAGERLESRDTGAARAEIEAFIDGVQRLLEADLLEGADGRSQIETAAAMADLMQSAGDHIWLK